jgi:hypothetical protein
LIKKLETSFLFDDNGQFSQFIGVHKPDNEDVIAKINEIIEYLNQKEQQEP